MGAGVESLPATSRAAFNSLGAVVWLTISISSSSAPVQRPGGRGRVTMRCGDECPLVRAKRQEEWQIPDPKEMPPEQYREVRDLIERKVKELLASLG